jgi:L-histidine Nalpha-methyltransferase
MTPHVAQSLPRCVVDCDAKGMDERALAEDVLDGLTRPFKELPPKYFYDDRGAELFDRICELPEYYPTRTERAILEQHASHVAQTTGAIEVVELGSGTAAKTRILLDALHEQGTLARYVPIDVTESLVRDCAATLIDEYPGLAVHGLVGDFGHHLHRLPPPIGPRLFVFLGGTLGNFPPGSRRRFLRTIKDAMTAQDFLLVGTDIVKDPATLCAAYDDSAGVTAEFNRNVLRVVNRELDADFDPSSFDHVALFDARNEWIEMRLRARTTHVVTIQALGLSVPFAAGEEMRTEISAKFTRPRLECDMTAAGMTLVQWLTDADGQFAVSVSCRRTDDDYLSGASLGEAPAPVQPRPARSARLDVRSLRAAGMLSAVFRSRP